MPQGHPSEQKQSYQRKEYSSLITSLLISLPDNYRNLPSELLLPQKSYWHTGYRNTPHTSLYMFLCQDFQFHKQVLHEASNQPYPPELEPRTNGLCLLTLNVR